MKNKKFIVWFIIAGVLALAGIYALFSQTEGGVITLIVAAILAFVGFLRFSAVKKAAMAEKQKADALTENKRLFNENHGIISCNIAGVTFDNDDGTSRQEILRKLLKSDDANLSVTFTPYTFKNKPAFYVICSGQCIGSVPAENVEEIASVIDRIESAYITPDKFKGGDGRTVYRADLRVQYAK